MKRYMMFWLALLIGASLSFAQPNPGGIIIPGAGSGGAATTATALAANPADCSTADGTEFSWSINASGDLSCVPVKFTSKTLDRKTSATTVTDSVAETTIYTYTIPAGTLDADGELRLTLLNEYLNNSGTNRSLTFKVKLGGSTVIEATTGPLGASALNRVFELYVRVTALGATNSQKVLFTGFVPAASGSAGTVTTGTGMATTVITSINFSSGLTALTQDMTLSKVLEVTVTHPTTTSTQTWTTYAASLELLNP